MSGPSDTPMDETPRPSRATAEAMVRRAPNDLVFTMRFLGQSQELLYSHFRRFLEDELTRAGISDAEHPLLPFFIDSHATELRDFVATGVALARPFSLGEIEFLTGDAETLMRVDIWDAIAAHIDMAEERFSKGIAKVVASLHEAEAQMPRRTE